VNLNDFIVSRRPRWERFSYLLDRYDGVGSLPLTTKDSEEIFTLYRLVSSDLSLMSTAGGSAAVTEYLQRLIARGYQSLSPPQHVSPFRAWWRLLRHDFPAAARRQWMVLLLAAGVMFGGTVFGWISTSIHPSTALSIVPREFWRQRPAQRVESRFKMQSGTHFSFSIGQNLAFTVMLFTHNILVGVLGFATAAVFGIISIGLLFYNGMMLGSLAQRYFADGVGTYLLAWVGPHGSFELPAICVASAAGLIIARAELTGGGRFGSVLVAIRAQRHDIVCLLLGAAHMFVVAGIFEGGFSQLTNAIIPYWLKIAVAALLFLILVEYLFFIPIDDAGSKPPALEYFRNVSGDANAVANAERDGLGLFQRPSLALAREKMKEAP